MSGKGSVAPSVIQGLNPGGVVVGGGGGAGARTLITGRGGAMVMRSVSIFLASGRKASVASKRAQLSSSIAGCGTGATTVRRRRRMPDDASAKSAAFTAKILETLKKRTKFTRTELEALCKIYWKLITSPGQHAGPTTTVNGMPSTAQTVEGIDRIIFRELLHNTFDIITEDALIERMFCCWDRESEGAIRLEAWILGLDVFLRGSQRDKMEFCFRVYDLNNDGFITKDEMFQLFKNCLIKQPSEEDPDEGVRDLSELALRKLDVDRDGKVSFEDYEIAVKEEPLLLEAFGQCLPTEENCVLSSPPNIGRGNYVYDPDSISQNEKILKLFVRLAVHTANRLNRLKIESNSKQGGSAARVPHQRIMHEEEIREKEGVGNGLENNGTDSGSGFSRLADKGAERIPDSIDSKVISEEDVSLIDGTSVTSAPEQKAVAELANRAFFSFGKKNYVTRYTDQSINTNGGDETVNNAGVSHRGNVDVNRAARGGEKSLFGIKSDGYRMLGRGAVSAGGVVVNRIAEALGLSVDQSGKENEDKTVGVGSGYDSGAVEVNRVAGSSRRSEIDQSMKGHQAVTMVAGSGSRDSAHPTQLTANQKKIGIISAGGIEQNNNLVASGHSSALKENQEQMGMISTGGIEQNHHLMAAASHSSASDSKRVSAQAGASVGVSDSEKIQGSDKSGVELTFESMPKESHSSLTSDFRKKMQQEESNRRQELKGFSSSHSAELQEEESIAERDHGAVYESAIRRAADLEKSAHSSSSGDLSKQTRHAYGSSFNAGGQIGVNFLHGTGTQDSDSEYQTRRISAAADVQAGSSTKVEASKGLSAEIGFGPFKAKMNFGRGGNEPKANLDGKLNLAAHVLVG